MRKWIENLGLRHTFVTTRDYPRTGRQLARGMQTGGRPVLYNMDTGGLP
jgi:hypothetical protein